MQRKRQVLFVQGAGQDVHDLWDNKLVESLQRELGEGYEIHYPRMPGEHDPKYAAWKSALEQAFSKLRPGAILVGHSIGATILLNTLAAGASAPECGAILLIAAPFVGEGGWSSDELAFSADRGLKLPKGVPIHFFHGLADSEVAVSHLDLYARSAPQAHVHRLPGLDHQFNDDLSEVARVILTLDEG